MNKHELTLLVADIFQSMRRDDLVFSDAVSLAVDKLAEKIGAFNAHQTPQQYAAHDVLLCKVREHLDFLGGDIIALVELQESIKKHGLKKIELTDGAYTFNAFQSERAKDLIAQALEYEHKFMSSRLDLLHNAENTLESLYAEFEESL